MIYDLLLIPWYESIGLDIKRRGLFDSVVLYNRIAHWHRN